MLVGEPALKIGDVRLADGRVGGEFDGSALHEAARRHDDFRLVPRHIPRLQLHEAVHGRRLLHRLDKGDELFAGAEADGARDVVRRLHDGGRGLKAQLFQAGADEQAPFQRLADDVRRQKHALVEGLVAVHIRADFRPDGRRGQAAGDALDEGALADDVPARGGDAAAGIFDQRPDGDVGAALRRLRLFDKFAVTVVDEDAAFKAAFPHEGAGGGDLFLAERVSPFIAARALNEHDLDGRVRKPRTDAVIVELPFRQIAFFEGNAVVGQRADALAGDHLVQGVVRVTGDGKESVARTQEAEQPHGEGVRTRKDVGRNDAGFRAEDVGKQGAEGIPALVAVAVAAGGREVAQGDAVVLEGLQYLFLIMIGDLFQAVELRGERALALFDELLNFILHRITP